MRKKSTTINEAARQALRITRDDYALCSYVQYRQADRRGRAGWCVDTKQEIADFIGITRQGLYKMIDRLCGENLLSVDAKTGDIQVTEKWIDAESECKQSLQRSVNKVDTECKQSLQRSVNKVTPNIEVEYEYKYEKSVREDEQHAPAPNFSADLNTENLLSKRPGGAALSPGWNDYPKADTPEELKAELSRFYATRPQDWRMTKEATPAQVWSRAQTEIVVAKFCDWAIGEGWEKRTFKQINARLRRWFKEEPLMQPKANAAPQQTFTASPEPRWAAYRPFPKDY